MQIGQQKNHHLRQAWHGVAVVNVSILMKANVLAVISIAGMLYHLHDAYVFIQFLNTFGTFLKAAAVQMTHQQQLGPISVRNENKKRD